MKKRVVSLILVLCMAASLLPVSALAYKDGDDVAYPVEGGNIWFDKATGTVTYCDQSVTSADIPDTIEGVAVTSIGAHAFDWCFSLTSIVIPNSVTSIGDYAFAHCDSLTSVIIPNSVTSIGDSAFYDCDSLTSVIIPNSVTSIGDDAFMNCDSLTSVVIPGSVTSIAYMSFAYSGLTSVVIHNGATTIENGAFDDCGSLTSIVIPSSVTSIGFSAFARCTSLKDVYYSGSKEQWENIDIGDVNSALKNATIHYNSPILEDSTTADDVESLSKEIILRARLLSTDYTFAYHRAAKSVVQIMADQLDPIAPSAWYTVENFLDMYFETLKKGSASPADVGDVSAVEFYEYLLFKLLDNKELNYMSLTKPFDLVDDLTGGAVSGDLLKELVKAGFKAGTKIEDKDKKAIKDVCVAYCGTDSLTDIGILDYFLTTGKSIDKFLSEFTKYYALATVSDAREEAVRLIGQTAEIPALRTAAENVCAGIESVKKQGVTYCLSEGAEAAASSLTTWIMGKMFDAMCELHPASKVWKKTVDYTTSAVDVIFRTDDIATDTIYIVGMSNVEKTLLSAINQAEKAFLADNSVENAQRYIALADTLQRDLIVGCDLSVSLVDHTERGDLNWHGLLDMINMIMPSPIKGDFPSLVKWMFGDPDSDYSHARESIQSIKRSIENTDFYTGTVSALDLLQNKDSVTPSPWAQAEVNRAISCGILPEWVRTNYQGNITRLEFCALLEFMIEEKTDKSVWQLADELEAVRGGQIKPPFDDALYMEANDIARLGIINGVGDNKFNPLGEITRQEAAIMLYRTADVLGYDTASSPSDHTGVADWAVQGVDFVTSRGIMSGTDHGFDPLGKYTKEQAILTLVRFFENL